MTGVRDGKIECEDIIDLGRNSDGSLAIGFLVLRRFIGSRIVAE